MFSFFHSFDRMINWFFPPVCVHCQREGTWLCQAAAEVLGKEIPQTIPMTGFERVLVRGSYDCVALQAVIQRLKYSYWTAAAETLGVFWAPVKPFISTWPKDALLVPIPLHPARRRQRGFNQADYLAAALSQLTGWPVVPLLRRRRATSAQAQLPAAARPENVKDAFALQGIPKTSVIILVDDVLTTGATFRAAAAAFATTTTPVRLFGLALAKG